MEDKFIIQQMLELAKQIDYEPTNINFLKEAMRCQIVHKPEDGTSRKNYTNDSFATLGDALLKFILTELLFDKGYDKGEITQRKQSLENNNALLNLCKKSGIYKYAYNGLTFFGNAPLENKVSCSKHDRYVEAVIAAIYKDKGIDYCKKWLIGFYQKYLNYICN